MRRLVRRRFVSGVMALALLGSVLAAQEQQPEIGGYCPVAYGVAGKALKGEQRYKSVYEGRTYWFLNADAKKMFDDNPAKFKIGYEGWCATAVAQGKLLKSDPRLFTIANGVTYLFSSADAKAAFDKDKAGIVAKADSQWKTVAPKHQ